MTPSIAKLMCTLSCDGVRGGDLINESTTLFQLRATEPTLVPATKPLVALPFESLAHGRCLDDDLSTLSERAL